MRPTSKDSSDRSSRRRGPLLRRAFAGLLFGVLLASLGPTVAQAQEGGTIAGRVTDAGSGAPIRFVQVFLPGTGLGALTRANGEFVIRDVPPGPHVVQTERIGLASVSHPVTVSTGKSIQVDFRLTPEVLSLDGIVIKGAPTASRPRPIKRGQPGR